MSQANRKSITTKTKRAGRNRDNDQKLIALDRKLAEIEGQKRDLVRRSIRDADALKATDARSDDVWGAAHEAYEQVLTMKPTTEAGYRALARAILRQCACNMDNEWPDTDLEAGVKLLLSSLAA